jgi:hypothetical protein
MMAITVAMHPRMGNTVTTSVQDLPKNLESMLSILGAGKLFVGCTRNPAEIRGVPVPLLGQYDNQNWTAENPSKTGSEYSNWRATANGVVIG